MIFNVGLIDRIIRFALAAVIAVLYFTKQIRGESALILGIIAAVLIITGFIGICPMYFPFRISTRKSVK